MQKHHFLLLNTLPKKPQPRFKIFKMAAIHFKKNYSGTFNINLIISKIKLKHLEEHGLNQHFDNFNLTLFNLNYSFLIKLLQLMRYFMFHFIKN